MTSAAKKCSCFWRGQNMLGVKEGQTVRKLTGVPKGCCGPSCVGMAELNCALEWNRHETTRKSCFIPQLSFPLFIHFLSCSTTVSFSASHLLVEPESGARHWMLCLQTPNDKMAGSTFKLWTQVDWAELTLKGQFTSKSKEHIAREQGAVHRQGSVCLWEKERRIESESMSTR